MTNTIGFAWSFLLFVAVCLIGVYDEHEPRYLSISLVLTWAAFSFTGFGLNLATMQDYGDRGWPHGTPDPRYLNNYGMLGLCWGGLFLTPLFACLFSFIFAKLRSENSSAVQKAAKALLPKIGYVMVCPLLADLPTVPTAQAAANPTTIIAPKQQLQLVYIRQKSPRSRFCAMATRWCCTATVASTATKATLCVCVCAAT
jgi:hypothetical protein